VPLGWRGIGSFGGLLLKPNSAAARRPKLGDGNTTAPRNEGRQ
jgi:hypothetical protein